VSIAIRTEHLLLRPWRRDDLAPLSAILADPLVARYLIGHPFSADEARAAFERRFEHWERNGFGFWAVETLDQPRLLGWAGLQCASAFLGYETDVEVGWTLAREVWGRGYATEAGTASLAFGFQQLALPRIVAMRDPANQRSDAVMQRLGMREAGSTTTSHGDPVSVRILWREEWVARQGAVGRADEGHERKKAQVLR